MKKTKMILSFSKTNNRSKVNRKIVTLCVVVVAAFGSGCSGYQSPAPIYGGTGATNPYENNPTEAPKQTVKTKKVIQPNSKTKVFSPNPANIEKKVATPVKKKRLSPAVIALVTEADRNSRSGDLESAVVTLERALRIDSRNPTLTYKLALLRLKQSKPRLAEDLAKKAALLAANDRDLKRQSWYLISEARRQQKNYHGAKEAKLKADSI